MSLLPWTRLPNAWIENGGLREFRWAHGQGANCLSALMVLTAIANHVDAQTGIARLSYDAMGIATDLSRAKLSAGLKKLVEFKLIELAGRSTYKLSDYDPASGWAQFPARGLYRDGVIVAFQNFHLRQPAELDALKLYFLFASRRDRRHNWALITYTNIERYTGVSRNSIRRALGVLAANSLVYTDYVASTKSDSGVASAYRLVYLNSHVHMGTVGRSTADVSDLSLAANPSSSSFDTLEAP